MYKRPQSASEVRETIERITAHDLSPRPPSPRGKGEDDDSPGERSLDNPLYRRVFVGREHEVRQLQAALDAALSGRGALAMVVRGITVASAS
jgi:hypothetical protein